MKGIVGCEYSQVVTKAFRKLGHEFYSCDILPAEGGHPEWHFQEDIFHVLHKSRFTAGFDLGIFHPPCTFLCNSGVRWLYNKDGSINKDRWEKMEQGALFFRSLLNSNCLGIAVENPIMHRHAKKIIGIEPTQIIQPWQFGHGEVKATCLWLKNLPKLKPTNIVEGRYARVHLLPPSEDRWKLRSTTYEGIGDAMASQWGIVHENVGSVQMTLM